MWHGAGRSCRTLFGIRTAQSSRFEPFSTLFQLKVSFSSVSVRGWKPFGVGGALQPGVKGLIWLAVRTAYVILLVTIIEESTLFFFFSLWVRVIEGDIG